MVGGRGRWALVGALVAAAGASAHAQEIDDAGTPAVPPAEEAPSEEDAGLPPRTTVHVGVYPVQIQSVDLAAASAQVTFYLWARWRGPANGGALELVNGTMDARENEYREDDGDVHYVSHRCRATVPIEVDFRRFPFDEHVIALELEHAEYDTVVIELAVDEANLRSLRSPPVSGWFVDDPVHEVVTHAYRTGWGTPSLPADYPAEYSRARTTMRLHHAPVASFGKTFLALFIAVLIASLAFFLDVADTGARTGTAVAGTFGAVTSYAVVAYSLPEISYLTLSDQIHVTGLGFVFFVLVETCVVAYLARTERAALARRINRVVGPVAALSFAAVVTGLALAS